jgi:hypothetical protein
LNDKEEPKDTIKDINDIEVLKEIYLKTGSRGKKQRVKKKLKALGFNQPIVMTNKNPSMMKKPNSKSNEDNFLSTKLELNSSLLIRQDKIHS